jgi:hypothetical protein
MYLGLKISASHNEGIFKFLDIADKQGLAINCSQQQQQQRHTVTSPLAPSCADDTVCTITTRASTSSAKSVMMNAARASSKSGKTALTTG